MSEKRWVKHTDDMYIAFTPIGCTGEGRGYSRYEKKWVTWDLRCKGTHPHGHASVGTEDGTCRFAFPIASQEGARRFLQLKDWLKDDERAAILALDEVQALPEALTEGERVILDDPERLQTFLNAAFVWP